MVEYARMPLCGSDFKKETSEVWSDSQLSSDGR